MLWNKHVRVKFIPTYKPFRGGKGWDWRFLLLFSPGSWCGEAASSQNKTASAVDFSFKHQNKTWKLFLNPAERLSRKFHELLCFCSAVGSNKHGLQGLGADKQTAAQQRSTVLSQRSRSRISKYQNNTQVWVFSSCRAERLRAGLWFPESGACVFHSLRQDEWPPSGDI